MAEDNNEFQGESTVAYTTFREASQEPEAAAERMAQMPTATPTYLRNHEFHHLAVRVPFIGQEKDSAIFQYNRRVQDDLVARIQTDHVWVIQPLDWQARAALKWRVEEAVEDEVEERKGRALSMEQRGEIYAQEREKLYRQELEAVCAKEGEVWKVTGTDPTDQHRRSEIMVNKRQEVNYDPEADDPRTRAPSLAKEDLPAWLRFSTLPDPEFWRDWCGDKGCYLGHGHDFFPKMKMFSYHRADREGEKRLVLSAFYEYCNGKSLWELLKLLDERSVVGRPPRRLAEPLIWHIVHEVGKAIVKLQRGEPRYADKDDVALLQEGAGWRPIVHGCIRADNIYLHFDMDAFERHTNRDSVEMAHVRCFPRVVLGGFGKADFQDDREQSFQARLSWAARRTKEKDIIHQRWWDLYSFGRLIGDMLFFGDVGLLEQVHYKRFPAILKQTKPSVTRSVERYAIPGVWSDDLAKEAFRFEYCLWGQVNGREQLNSPGTREEDITRIIMNPGLRRRIPRLKTLEEKVLPKARDKVEAFKRLTYAQLRAETNDECDLTLLRPWIEEDTKIYRPSAKQVNLRLNQSELVNSLEIVRHDMEHFKSPWSYVFVKYHPDRIRFDGQLFPQPQTDHGVLPFGYIPDVGARAPEGTASDEEEERERAQSGKTVQEIGRAKREQREEAARLREERRSWEPPPPHEREEAERREIEEEEAAFQRRRDKAAWLNRGDILLEALNDIIT